ncbi:MAG: tetratricopeptide repeat protein, partial [Limisphaerales bacterium]
AICIILFIFWRHQQNQIEAGDALTQALISTAANSNPSQFAQGYLDVANDYSGTPAGERALLQGAAILFAEGKYTDARADFQRYLDEHPDDEFSAMAALGVGRCLEAEGKISDTIGQYQHVINDFADVQSVNQARFSLARLNMQQGHYADAFQGFQQVMQADPYGSLGNQASQYALELRSKLPRQGSASGNAPMNQTHSR